MTQQTDSPDASSTRPSSTRYVVLGGLCAAAAIAYIQRYCVSVAESTIREDLGLTKYQMGWMFSTFFWTYAIFQIPSGWLGDRLGSRKTLSLYSILWSLATFVMICSGTAVTLYFAIWTRFEGVAIFVAWQCLLFGRLLSGIGQAGIFPCSAIIIARWMPVARRSLATGFSASFQQVGLALALILTGPLIDLIGWRWTFAVYTIPGFIWAVWFYRWFRDNPREHPAVDPHELSLITGPERASVSENDDSGNESESTPWLAMASSPAMWWICGQQFFRGAGYVILGTWFPTFLQETRGVSVSESGMLTSLTIAGAFFGSLVGGFVSDWILSSTKSRRLSRQGVAIFGMVSCAVCIFMAYFIENTEAAVLVISAGMFFASLAGPAGYTVTIEMGGEHIATTFGTMNMSGNLGAAIFPIVVPLLLELPGGWNLVLIVFGSIYLAAAFCWAMLNPNGTVFDQARFGQK